MIDDNDEIERSLTRERAEWLSKRNTAQQQNQPRRSGKPADSAKRQVCQIRVEIEHIVDGETGGERWWIYEIATGGRRQPQSSTTSFNNADDIADGYEARGITVKWIDRR